MSLKYLIAISLALTACTGDNSNEIFYVSEFHCSTPQEKERLAKFIVDCSRASVGGYTEDSRGAIALCDSTGKELFCPRHKHKVTREGRLIWTEEAADNHGAELNKDAIG